MGKKAEGFYTITETVDETAPLYGDGIEFHCFFSGKSDDIKEELRQAEQAYSTTLQRAYKLLDPNTEYNGFPNLASINHNLNTPVSVNEELFAVLQDAYAKTLEEKGYNIFAGSLYQYWYSILILQDAEDFDPLFNADEADRIGRLAEATADLENFSLTFDESNRTVTFSVSDKYLKLCEELEVSSDFLDCNLLKDAYMLKIVVPVLEAKDFGRGYILTNSGLSVSLSGYSSGKYVYYDYIGGQVRQMSTVDAKAGSVCSTFRTFAMAKNEAYYHQYEKEGKTYYRNPYVSVSKEGFGNFLRGSFVVGEDDISDVVYTNVKLLAADTEEAVKSVLSDVPYTCEYALWNR
ncbi:MAG: hypothetical protein MJ114_06870 [Acetatifactor sp.]|nr:hypothetical protein [Acetatifactor sp.]